MQAHADTIETLATGLIVREADARGRRITAGGSSSTPSSRSQPATTFRSSRLARVHPLQGQRDAGERWVRRTRRRTRRRGARKRVHRRTRGDRRDRPGDRRPGGTGPRRRPTLMEAALGASANAALPASGSSRPPTTTARWRSTRSSASWSASRSRSSRARQPRSASPAPGFARGTKTTSLHAASSVRASTAMIETASFATRSAPAPRGRRAPRRICGYATRLRLRLARGRRDQRRPDRTAQLRRDTSSVSGSSSRRAMPSSSAGASPRAALVQQSTLMTIGLYNEPTGAWLPSILF